MAERLREVDIHWRSITKTLESIRWESKLDTDGKTPKQSESHHIVQSTASEACRFLCDFLFELVGREEVEREARRLSQAVFTIEFVAYTPRNAWEMLSWLLGMIEIVVSSSLDLQSCQSEVGWAVSNLLKGGYSFKKLLIQLFDGTRILRQIQENGLLITEEQPSSMLLPCPVLFTLHVSLLVLLHSAEITQKDWRQIKAKLLKQLVNIDEEYGHVYPPKVRAIFQTVQNELDCFRENTVAAALECAPVGVQELVRELFSH